MVSDGNGPVSMQPLGQLGEDGRTKRVLASTVASIQPSSFFFARWVKPFGIRSSFCHQTSKTSFRPVDVESVLCWKHPLISYYGSVL